MHNFLTRRERGRSRALFAGLRCATHRIDDHIIHGSPDCCRRRASIRTRRILQHADLVSIVNQISPFVGGQGYLTPGVGCFQNRGVAVPTLFGDCRHASDLIEKRLLAGDTFGVHGTSQQTSHLLREHRHVR